MQGQSLRNFFKVRPFVWNLEELRAIKALLYSFVYIVLVSLTMQIEVFRGTDVSYVCPRTVVLYVTDEYTSRQLGKVNYMSIVLHFCDLQIHRVSSLVLMEGAQF
jgi:hypothetical protein